MTIIGGGPSGLTAAYLLAKAGVRVTVLEADDRYLGGISRTVEYKGFRFDIGGHRFFSKSAEVEEFWTEILGDDLISRPRLSRIYYKQRFYSYPLKAREALLNLGAVESLRCVFSYLYFRAFPINDVRSFEDWVTNKFGRRLFEIFFRTYTEKVWGMSCKEISADWAAQRIKDFSLGAAIQNALLPAGNANGGGTIKTLIDRFRYPRLGPGMMWQRCAEKATALGARIVKGQKAVRCTYDESVERWTVETQDAAGDSHAYTSSHVISTAAIADLALMIRPEFSLAAMESAGKLRYRDFLTVALMVKSAPDLDDNWIYIHDGAVRVGRIQNFKAWSPEMVPSAEYNCFGLEYFCFEGDGLWTSSDAELVELATRELKQLGLLKTGQVMDGTVVRQPKAYPVYDDHYRTHVGVIRQEIVERYPNLHLVGRNGMHKYNNQDHAMMTAMLSVKNILAGSMAYDIWQVNEDAEYQESESGTSGLRAVPMSITASGKR